MLVGGMVRDEVQDEAYAARVQLFDQAVEILQRSEQWIYVAEISNVVAEVEHRRSVDRREPQGVDAEPFKMVQATDQAGKIALTITVAVLKRDRYDLVDDRALPPF